VGALAHFLKNRFYIGEVVYRGETHAGEHASIIDRPTFDAVQALLAQNARARQVRLNGSPAILMGRIFDDRGNRLTPSHSNKDGVRYRYYVSHPLLQRGKKNAGRVARVPAVQLEKLVVEAIRAKAWPDTEPKGDLSDREVIDRYVRVALTLSRCLQDAFGQHRSACPRLLARRQIGPCPIQRRPQQNDSLIVEPHAGAQFPGIMNTTVLPRVDDAAMTVAGK
jgi:hypothetical protein